MTLMLAHLVGSLDRSVEELLHACGVRTTATSAESLALLTSPSAPQPDVVVVDLRDGSPLPPAIAHIRRQHPTTGVVIVASHLDPALMLEAMRAGVNEFVTQPTTAGDLRVALDRVAAKRPRPEPGQVFAFVGGKGGVGTTTLAVNVAVSLASKQASSTLFVDLHVTYGDAAVFLGIEPRFSVADALENVDRVDEAFLRGIVAKTKTGLDVLASSDRALIGHVDIRAVRNLIDCAARHYPVVILDVPRSDATVLDALELSTASWSSQIRNSRRFAAPGGWRQHSVSDMARTGSPSSSHASTRWPRSAARTSSGSWADRLSTCSRATIGWRSIPSTKGVRSCSTTTTSSPTRTPRLRETWLSVRALSL